MTRVVHGGLLPRVIPMRQPSTAYALGDKVYPNISYNIHTLKCVQAGTTSATASASVTFNVYPSSFPPTTDTTDGTVKWRDVTGDVAEGSWDYALSSPYGYYAAGADMSTGVPSWSWEGDLYVAWGYTYMFDVAQVAAVLKGTYYLTNGVAPFTYTTNYNFDLRTSFRAISADPTIWPPVYKKGAILRMNHGTHFTFEAPQTFIGFRMEFQAKPITIKPREGVFALIDCDVIIDNSWYVLPGYPKQFYFIIYGFVIFTQVEFTCDGGAQLIATTSNAILRLTNITLVGNLPFDLIKVFNDDAAEVEIIGCDLTALEGKVFNLEDTKGGSLRAILEGCALPLSGFSIGNEKALARNPSMNFYIELKGCSQESPILDQLSHEIITTGGRVKKVTEIYRLGGATDYLEVPYSYRVSLQSDLWPDHNVELLHIEADVEPFIGLISVDVLLPDPQDQFPEGSIFIDAVYPDQRTSGKMQENAMVSSIGGASIFPSEATWQGGLLGHSSKKLSVGASPTTKGRLHIIVWAKGCGGKEFYICPRVRFEKV